MSDKCSHENDLVIQCEESDACSRWYKLGNIRLLDESHTVVRSMINYSKVEIFSTNP